MTFRPLPFLLLTHAIACNPDYSVGKNDDTADGGGDDPGSSLETGVYDTADTGCKVRHTNYSWAEPDLCLGNEVGEGTRNISYEWSWTGVSTNSRINDVISTPAVLPFWDTNSDGQVDRNDPPGVFFIASEGGRSGTLVGYTVPGNYGFEIPAVNGLSFDPHSSPTAGDVDHDGTREVLAVLQDGHIAAIDPDGATKWISTATVPGSTALGLFDIDGDHLLEIVAGGYLVDYQGNLLGNVGSAVCSPDVTFIADIDGDGTGEWVAAGALRDKYGNAKKTFSTTPFCFAAPWAEPGGATQLIGTDGGTGIRRVSLDGTVNWSYTASATIGPPAVGDIDADGSPEICFTFAGDTFIWDEENGVTRVIDGTDDGSTTGCALADLDGDGAMDIIRAGGGRATVYNVHDGQEILSDTHSTSSGYFTAMGVDVDADGSTEVLYPADDIKGGNRAGIWAYGNPDRTWIAAARRLWPHHAYDPNQISDDGEVQPAGLYTAGDRFRCQYSIPSPRGVALQVELVDACADSCDPVTTGEVSFFVRNRGGIEAIDVVVDLYDVATGEHLATVNMGYLASGDISASRSYIVNWAASPDGVLLEPSFDGHLCQDIPDVLVPVPCD